MATVVVWPLKAVPVPAMMFEPPIHHSPPATPLARPPTSGSVAPLTASATPAVPTGTELGVRVMPLKVGAVRSTRSVAVTRAPQLPAASWAWTETAWLPAASAATVVAGIVPKRPVDGDAAPTPRAVPEPSAAAESMKYSPAVMMELPVAVSLAAASIATACPLAADGASARPLGHRARPVDRQRDRAGGAPAAGRILAVHVEVVGAAPERREVRARRDRPGVGIVALRSTLAVPGAAMAHRSCRRRPRRRSTRPRSPSSPSR